MEEVYTCGDCKGQLLTIFSDRVRCEKCQAEIFVRMLQLPREFNEWPHEIRRAEAGSEQE